MQRRRNAEPEGEVVLEEAELLTQLSSERKSADRQHVVGSTVSVDTDLWRLLYVI